MDFVESCRRLVSLDSTPEAGSFEACQFLAELCKERGLHVELQEEMSQSLRQANVIARPTANRPGLEFMLQTHIDTRDPGPFGLWTQTEQNPFDATIIDGNIYGLGTADAKLDFLCKLEALSSFKNKPFTKLPPVLVATFGEETGMQGALKLIRKNKVSAKMAMLGEPSDLKIITAAKGFATVEIKIPFSDQEIQYREEHNLRESTVTQSRLFTGKPSHSSTPHLGDSAVIKMMEALCLLPDHVVLMEIDGGLTYNSVPAHAMLEVDIVSVIHDPVKKKIVEIYQAIKNLEEEFKKYTDADFTPEHPTLNIGVIRTFADHVLIGGSCRMPPVITQELYEKWMGQLKSVCVSLKSEFKITDYKRPYRTPENSLLVRGCLEELKIRSRDSKTITQPNTNEASLFSRIGIECVGFGAGKRDGNLHTPNEHVKIKDLEFSIEFYKACLERFCL